MLKTIPHPPPKFKHRKISAVRNFPKGCQISSRGAISEKVMETLPPPAGSEPFTVGDLASASNSNQKEEADEPNRSTPPEKEIKNEVVEDNGNEDWGEANGKMEVAGMEIVEYGGKVEKPEALDLFPENSLVAGMEIVEYGGEVEKPDLFSENLDLPQFASRIFGVVKKRKMSAVRGFPVGCGRNASKIGLEDSMMAASSESKTGGAKDEDDEGKKIAKPVQEKRVLESRGEFRVKSPKPRTSEGNGEKMPKQQVVGSVKQTREKFGEVRNGVRVESLLKSSRDENIMENMFSMKSTSEKRMEGSGDKQVSKNQIVKQRRDVSGPSGSKVLDKGGRSMMKKSFGNVSVKRSKDGGNNALTRYSSEEVQHEGNSARQMVKKTLRLFEKLVEEEETGSKKNGRVDLKAASVLKKSNKWVNYGNPTVGDVPGVEVGDEFHFRVELSIIGLHRPFQGGIDYMKRSDGKIVATSIVASGGYPDDLDSSDVLIYSGSGGNPDTKKNKQAGDQKLERGNLALKNSMDFKTPVRVIYGSKEQFKSSYLDSKAKMVTTFNYDGLYLVEKYWTEPGANGFSVFKFQLRRRPRNRITREDTHERERERVV